MWYRLPRLLPLIIGVALVTVVVAAGRGADAATTPNDPQVSAQWGLTKVRAPEAWDVTKGSTSVKVAIVDTGVRVFPDLVGQLGTGVNIVTPGGSTDDSYGSYGSGTGVASIIGAATNNSRDMAGLNWNITMLPVKVCDWTLGCTPAMTAAGINWAVANGAQIINVSMTFDASPDIDAAVANAISHNVLVVAAAGNVAARSFYPAHSPGVIAVGATDQNDAITSFSSLNPTLVAPGQLITVLVTAGCCMQLTNTTLAAAHVSGALALLLAAGVPPASAKTAVLQGAKDLGAAGVDSIYGYGRLDICNALVKAGKSCPAGAIATATPTSTSAPALATATPTRTSTPAPATATPTRTSTPAVATATPTRTSTPAVATATPTKSPAPTATWTAVPMVHETLVKSGKLRSPSPVYEILSSGKVVPGQLITASITFQNSAVVDLLLYGGSQVVAVGTGTGNTRSLTFTAGFWDSYWAKVVLKSGQTATYDLSLRY